MEEIVKAAGSLTSMDGRIVIGSLFIAVMVVFVAFAFRLLYLVSKNTRSVDSSGGGEVYSSADGVGGGDGGGGD
jgi:hypothetical protein